MTLRKAAQRLYDWYATDHDGTPQSWRTHDALQRWADLKKALESADRRDADLRAKVEDVKFDVDAARSLRHTWPEPGEPLATKIMIRFLDRLFAVVDAARRSLAATDEAARAEEEEKRD